MSLNNISLPPQLVADLYHKSLVQSTASPVPSKSGFTFLGKNEKHILIVVNNADVPYLPDAELNFLTNILSACQLGLADVAIINWQTTSPKDPAPIFEQLNSRQVILFDMAPAAFGMADNVSHYAIVSQQGRQFVAAPSLTTLEKNKEAKKQLWGALKQLFAI